MKKISFKSSVILLIFCLFTSGELLPCASPAHGYGMRKEALVLRSKTILLVRATKIGFLVKEVLSGDPDLVDIYLPSGQTIKGTLPDMVFSSDYSNHFQDHTDPVFWKDAFGQEDLGRSPFPCCVCGPLHEFIEGHDYLLFPEYIGAMKSAERIRSKEDKWYQYVLEAVRSKKTANDIL